MHEEALRLNRMCPELKRKDILKNVLKYYHERSLTLYQDIDHEDDFQVIQISNLAYRRVFLGSIRTSHGSSFHTVPAVPVLS